MSTIDPLVPGVPGFDGSSVIDIVPGPSGAEEAPPVEVVVSPDIDPQLMIRWSDDGGKTFHSERQRSMGRIGQHTWEINVNRCGTCRPGGSRVFELSGTSKTFLALTGIGCEVDVLNK